MCQFTRFVLPLYLLFFAFPAVADSFFVQDTIPVSCPVDQVISCEQFNPNLSIYGQATASGICPLQQIEESDDLSLFDSMCNKGTIVRQFNALDSCGNSGQCTQRIVVQYDPVYFIKFPDDTLITNCSLERNFGYPLFSGPSCSQLSATYEDMIYGLQPVNACYRIERTWTIVNACTYDPVLPLIYVPNPRPVAQQANPANAPGPTVSACGTPAPWAPSLSKIAPTDTVATNFCTFWKADANGYVYKQIIDILDTNKPVFSNCPSGPLVFFDSTQNNPGYWNNVFDPALPAQNLKETEVGLAIQATDSCLGANINLQYILYLDLDGDGVTETRIDCRYQPVDSVYYGNALTPNYSGGTARAFDTRAVPQNQKWRFVIQEIYTPEFRTAAVKWNTAAAPGVYVDPQLPVGNHWIRWQAEDGCGNVGVCEYPILIQTDTLNCVPPPDVTVTCEQFDPTFTHYGEPLFSGNCVLDTVLYSANYTQFDTICSRGTITRVFNGFDACGNAGQCKQRILVQYVQDYYVKFPNDVILSTCDGTGNYGEPVFFGIDCELPAFSFSDFSEPGVPDACIKFERTWSVINWCTYDPLLPLIRVPNPNPNAISNHPSNLPGPIVSACGTLPPWAATVVKISPTDPTPTDYCSFWNAGANGYVYTQNVKIVDTQFPVLESCPLSPVHVPDTTQNDPAYWNNVFNPAFPLQDLHESPLDLSVKSTDACSGSNVNIEYLLFLDMDADSQQETVISSRALGTGGLGWNNVLYNNLNTPGYSGGTPTAFDNRPVPDQQKWGFSLQQSVSGNQRTAYVRWNTQQSPNTYRLPELPNGRHRIKWLITDACGNNKACEYPFSIGDTTLVGAYQPEKEGFILYQNEPNPFAGGSTLIRFQLPEATVATLSVFDASGRLLYEETTDYPQGMHCIVLEKAQLNSAGVLFYKLEAGRQIAWKKMLSLD